MTLSNKQVKSYMKQQFIQNFQSHIESGKMSKELGNVFFRTVFESSDLVEDICTRVSENDRSFLGFELIDTPKAMDGLLNSMGANQCEIHSNYDLFSIYSVDVLNLRLYAFMPHCGVYLDVI